VKIFRLLILFVAVSLAVHAQAPSATGQDWIRLADGAVYFGTYISSDGHTVHFRTTDGVVREWDRTMVQSVFIEKNQYRGASTAPAKTVPAKTPQPTPASIVERLLSGNEYSRYVSAAVRTCMEGPLPAVASPTGSSVSVNQAELAIEYHNCARKEVGTPPLKWSPELAAAAQKWSEHLASTTCKMQHTPNNPYGQNIFWGTGRPYGAFDAAVAWYSERVTGNFRNHYIGDSDTTEVGHYTQVIWKNTTEVGIGQASCAGGGVIITADYSPPGNYMGQTAY